jgi:hypothetical protein
MMHQRRFTKEFEVEAVRQVQTAGEASVRSSHIRSRRISVGAGYSGDGLFTEPIAVAQPWRREPLFVRPIAVIEGDPAGEGAADRPQTVCGPPPSITRRAGWAAWSGTL